jgi:hypothetical protein
MALEIRRNKGVFKLVVDLTDQIKARNIMQKEVVDKTLEIQRTNELIGEKTAEKNKTAMSLALLILQLTENGQQMEDINEIFLQDNEMMNIARNNLSDLTRALHIIYDLDVVTQNLTPEQRVMIEDQTRDW